MQMLMCMRLASGGAPEIDVETVVIRLGARVSAGAVQKALDATQDEFDVLRCSFASAGTSDWEIRQHAAAERARLKVMKLTAGQHADTQLAGDLRLLADELAGEPFDLGKPPLWRCVLATSPCEGEDVVLITVHHLMYDGYCAPELIGYFLRKLTQAMAGDVEIAGDARDACDAGTANVFGDSIPAETRRTRLSNTEFASRVAGLPGEGAATAWKAQLEGASGELDLRLARPDLPGTRKQAIAQPSILRAVAPELMRQVRATARSIDVTPATLGQLAWAVLLSRYSGQTDVVWGNTRSGRALLSKEAESTVGMCIVTLPVRLTVTPGATAAELARTLRAAQLAVRPFEHTPLLSIKQWAGMSGVPFGSIFVFDPQHVATAISRDSSTLMGRKVDVRIVARPGVPLCLLLGEGDTPVAELVYRSGFISDDTAGRILNHYLHLLAEIAADPHRQICAVPHQPLAELPAEDKAFPEGDARLITAQFRETASGHPEAPAVSFQGTTLSYRRLDELSSALADAVARIGPAPGEAVPMFMGRCLAFPVAALGVLKAGCAYVPMERHGPIARQASIVAALEPRVAICTSDTREHARECGLRQIIEITPEGQIVSLPDSITSNMAGPKPATIVADSAAYVMFTSGSTGTPKGVVVPHRAVVRLIRNTFLPFTPSDRYLLHSALAFDASTLELWAPLLTGGHVEVCPGDGLDIPALGEALVRGRVNRLWLTSTVFDRIIDSFPGILAPLESLLIGGEALSPSHVAKAMVMYPRLNLINGYGPTENTTFSTTHLITYGDLDGHPIPIGKPIDHSTCHLVDHHGQPCDVGFAGELYFGGEGVALGYLNDEKLTREKFLDAGLPAITRQRVYRSGDFARRRGDGVIDFLGRVDTQLKIRGMRIDLGEIQSAITNVSGITAAAVFTDGERATKRIVAAVVAESQQVVDALPGQLRKVLPAYMQPAQLFRVQELPTTASGKADTAALLKLMPATAAEDADPAHAPSPEVLIAKLMARAIGLPAAPTDVGFRDLGGHSLAAVDLVQSIERDFGVKIGPNALAHNPTASEVARTVAEYRNGARSPIVVQLSVRSLKKSILLVPGFATSLVSMGALATELGREYEVLGGRYFGSEPGEAPPASLEEIAAKQAAALLADGHCPHAVIGHSLGGLVAYELANQLAIAGRAPRHVILIDTKTPEAIERGFSIGEQLYRMPRRLYVAATRPRHSYQALIYKLNRLARESTFESSYKKPMTVDDPFVDPRVRRIAKRIGYMPQQKGVHTLETAVIQALGKYEPKRPSAECRIQLIASRRSVSLFDSRLGWARVLGVRPPLKLVNLRHSEMIQHPHVQVVAKLIFDTLNLA